MNVSNSVLLLLSRATTCSTSAEPGKLVSPADNVAASSVFLAIQHLDWATIETGMSLPVPLHTGAMLR